MKRLLLRLVAWLCDVKPAGRCSPDGLGHYFGAGDRCQCGALPSSATASFYEAAGSSRRS